MTTETPKLEGAPERPCAWSTPQEDGTPAMRSGKFYILTTTQGEELVSEDMFRARGAAGASAAKVRRLEERIRELEGAVGALAKVRAGVDQQQGQ